MKWTDRIGRRVKLRDLHIALAVAEADSMTRAAEALAVSYPVRTPIAGSCAASGNGRCEA